jgi:hypothetical protein
MQFHYFLGDIEPQTGPTGSWETVVGLIDLAELGEEEVLFFFGE